MKVLVLWENSAERALADNLVNVLRKIGAMLVYGKVNETGVLLEDWKSKPKVTLECLATSAPSANFTPGGGGSAVRAVNSRDGVSYSYEMDYVDEYGYGSPVYAARGYAYPGTLSVTRELMNGLVAKFIDDDNAKATKKTKPVVPQPKTTKTGVTVRDLDIWEEDEHDDDDPFGMDEG
jgi:hypothetical protein